MRLNYFGYFIEDHIENKIHLFDVRPFIKAFCSIESVLFKNSFKYTGEFVYILPVSSNIYLFLMTRSNEIIKKINTNNLNVDEIYGILNQGEHLGFASYIYFKENYLGFASTTFAPKIGALASFIDNIFERLKLKYNFVVESILHQASKSDALGLDFIGRTVVEIDRYNDFFKDFSNVLTGSSDGNNLDIDSFEIIIKPKRKKSIASFVKKAILKSGDEGVDKFIIKAKDDIHDHLTDLYLVGKGAISDNINSKDELTIYESIVSKTDGNQLLKQKIEEFSNDERFTKEQPKNISVFYNADSWSNFLHTV